MNVAAINANRWMFIGVIELCFIGYSEIKGSIVIGEVILQNRE